MPRGDRTGPEGCGPRTGRGLGYCSEYDSPGFTKGNFRGGYGRGFRRGYGRNYWNPIQSEPIRENDTRNERKVVEEEIKDLSEQIDSLKKELKKLK